MNPVILFRKDRPTEDELEVAKRYFDVYECRSEVPKGSLVFGRYSTLPFYKELEKDLKNNGSVLVNTSEQYNWIADFQWYDLLEEYTFKTWFKAADLPDDGTQFVVKGRTNSRKHEWNRLMFAKDKKAAIEIMLTLNEDSLIGPQGLVFRKFEELVTFEIGNNGLPFTNEYRFYFYKGEYIAHGYYWTMAENIEHKISGEGYRFAKRIGKMVADYSNFYVIDVAERKAGGWVVVEVNDAQMGGLSEITCEQFYESLNAHVRFDGKKLQLV